MAASTGVSEWGDLGTGGTKSEHMWKYLLKVKNKDKKGTSMEIHLVYLWLTLDSY